MLKNVYSAAEARNEFAEILNTVVYSGIPVTIEKYGKPVAEVIKAERRRPPVEVLEKYAGMWKNKKWASRVGKPSRYFRKKDYRL